MRVSLGTAHALGLCKIRVLDLPTTGYFLAGERCASDCAFCAQARSSSRDGRYLSRVSWPVFPTEAILERLSSGKAPLKRICLQVVDNEDARIQASSFIKDLRRCTQIPISVSIRARDLSDVEEFLRRGAKIVTIPLDCVTEEVFRRVKEGSLRERRDLLHAAASRFPSRIATHLIVGLGETEREMVEILLELQEIGVGVGLFAFTPISGTRMERGLLPDLASYRRIQAAHYLIRQGKGSSLKWQEGRLTFGQNVFEMAELLGRGAAFQTSGCADCNRPYYNESPGGPIYNYPRPLKRDEIEAALALLGKD